MKNITKYITEGSKRFTLEDSERDALATFIGQLSGALGDDDDIKSLEVIHKALSQQDLKQLDELYDFLDDYETYKKINQSNLKDDIELIKKIYNIAVVSNVLDEQWDLMDAFEKICV